MKEEFTKEQLKEIEKMFDVQVSLLLSFYANIIISFGKIEGSKEILSKLLNEFVKAFDCYRTISAKANEMQKLEIGK